MNTFTYLSDPQLRSLYLPALAGGLAIVLMCALLSIPAVLKRMAFVGQGVSHAGFGGIGVAGVLGAVWAPARAPEAQFLIVVAFCVLTALGISTFTDRRGLFVDTAIGVFLVASMAIGAVLVKVGGELAASRGAPGLNRSWESLLFGSLTAVSARDALLAWGVALSVLATLWLVRRPMTFWALDESASPAFGVPAGLMKSLLIVLLAVAVVTAMKLAGVVLATALLILPGAAALQCARRLLPVVLLACAFGIGGLVGGMILSFELDWPPGASMVLVLTAFLVLSWLGSRVLASRRASPPGPAHDRSTVPA